LQDRLRPPGSNATNALPFEFRVLEAIFVSVVGAQQSELEVLTGLVTNLLAFLEEQIDRERLKELLQYSKRLSKFEQRVLAMRDAIEEVLEQDEDLAAMYLTDKANDHPHQPTEHDDVELLLETYLKQIEEIANSVASLISHMRATEDIVNIMLDSQRNSLLLLELRIAMGTLGFTSGAFVVGMFGMNLHNYLEQDPRAFVLVSGVAVVLALSVFSVMTRKMKQMVRRW